MAKPPPKGARRPAAPQPVAVRLPITLGQFLKVAQLASSGGEAKTLIAEGEVQVNGEVDRRRGRKLVPGDVVGARGESARVTAGAEAADDHGGRPGRAGSTLGPTE